MSFFCTNILTITKIPVNIKMGNRRMAVRFIIKGTFPKDLKSIFLTMTSNK